MRKTTLKDIAKKSGVSVKTVSRALNNYPDINKETRKKILEVAEDYSYRPNLLARSLRQNKSYAIGYVISDTTNEFFWNVAFAIENKFKKHGYSMLTCFTNGISEIEIAALKLLVSRQVDGIILAATGGTDNFVREIIEVLRIPLVIIDNKVRGLKSNLVLHDNIKGAFLLTKHLIEHGYKNIACIAGLTEETSGKKRLEGYMKALTKFNIPINEELIKISNWKISGGYDSTIELFRNSKLKPRAIFIANSVMALGTLKALKQMKMSVPEDVALVSFDSLSFVEATNPPLTTLEKSDKEIGETAAKILYENIINKESIGIKEVYIKAGLCIRESCGCNEGRH